MSQPAAAIDLGTNTARLLIGDVDEAGFIAPLLVKRCITRLGGGFTRMKDLPAAATGSRVKIAGSVIRYQTPPTRNGKRVVYVIMEDGTGVADVTVFGDVQERCGHVLFRAGWLIVKGKVQRRGQKGVSIIAQDLSALPPEKPA